MKKVLKKITDFGIRPSHDDWEIFFIRKLNLITLIGTLNVGSSALMLPLLGIYDYQAEMITMTIFGPIIFLLNKYIGYMLASYTFYVPAAFLMFFLCTKMGIDSYIIIFFFPLIFSVVHLLGRKETFNHFLIVMGIFTISIISIVISYSSGFLSLNYPPYIFKELRLFIILLGMITSLGFFAIVTYESIFRETLIKRMLREKEILLAEVYHRVKNNMSLVTGLLNLKKNNSQSKEVQEALEACRSRVYSMALVHEKFFTHQSASGIDFTQYARELVLAIANSFGEEEAEIRITADELRLDLSQAIPCGLILNELLTNSFKHASPERGKLQIHVQLRNENGQAIIQINDNGTHNAEKDKTPSGSMGIELVSGLCEQLDATCELKRENGYTYRIAFTPKKTKSFLTAG